MLKLFMISGPNIPNCFFKAATPKAAFDVLCSGLSKDLIEKLKTDIRYTVKEMTWDKLFEILPDEFTIVDSVEF